MSLPSPTETLVSDKGVATAIKVTEKSSCSRSQQHGDESASRSFKSRLLRTVDRYWLFEFFGLFLAFSSLAAVIALLAVCGNQPSPNWTLTIGKGRLRKTLGLTLNTILSICGTVFSSALLIPVASSMSQLKWVWFVRGRPLAHYQAFESAARGPLGSIMLLWTLRCRRLACIGAVIIIAALGISFSIQALVVYPLVAVPTGQSTIARTNVNFGNTVGLDDLTSNMRGAIYAVLYQYTQPSVSFSCPTGNCTWPEAYTSLGFCSQCYNITTSLKPACGTEPVSTLDSSGNITGYIDAPYCNYTLPNGLELIGLPSINVTDLVISGSRNNTVNFPDPATVSVLTTIQGSWESSPPQWENMLAHHNDTTESEGLISWDATECGLFYCAQKFNTTIVEGTLDEKQAR
ncbi:hypothetical protein PV11_03145 [Exophiala sideris]|uniref:Uncharacterized protein n=1 Tax=Exophiala sideris TaxID=1016849 RepID=A0A0D1XHF9_9EURO|nr:hypothetical protein PV11_03145 [Exophiala sideris]